jgi:hypothetical protein
MPRPKIITPVQFTAALIAVLTITVLILILSLAKYGRPKENLLPVEIAWGKFSVPVPDGSAAILTEAIKIRNASSAPIPLITLQVNKRFFFELEKPLESMEEKVIPLTEFKTKQVQPFRPDDGSVSLVTVYGQLPDRSRGVTDFRPVRQQAAIPDGPEGRPLELREVKPE